MVGRNNCSSFSQSALHVHTHSHNTERRVFAAALKDTLANTHTPSQPALVSLSLSLFFGRTDGRRADERKDGSGWGVWCGARVRVHQWEHSIRQVRRRSPSTPKRSSFASSSFSPARARPAHAATLSGTHPVTPDPEP
jgi:hypothetical protein